MRRSTVVTLSSIAVLATLCLLPTLINGDVSETYTVVPESVATGVETRDVNRNVELKADECLAVVVVMAGQGDLGSLPLREKDAKEDLARDDRVGSLHQVQLCTRTARTVNIADYAPGAMSTDPKREFRWVVLTAPSSRVGGNTALNRGVVPID